MEYIKYESSEVVTLSLKRYESMKMEIDMLNTLRAEIESSPRMTKEKVEKLLECIRETKYLLFGEAVCEFKIIDDEDIE